MQPSRRRPMYYFGTMLHDGTIIAAYPDRKPTPKWLRAQGARLEHGVASLGSRTGKELRDPHNVTRFRFQDIIANSLNCKSALREIVLPPLQELHAEVVSLREEVRTLRELLVAPNHKDAEGG